MLQIVLKCLKYENIQSGGFPFQGNAKNIFFSDFCEKSVAQTSILHIFFKEGKGVSLGLFHTRHPGRIKADTQFCSPNAECEGYPLKKREISVATFIFCFKQITTQYLSSTLLKCLKYENIQSGGCPFQGNAENIFFSDFCEKSVAQTSI